MLFTGISKKTTENCDRLGRKRGRHFSSTSLGLGCRIKANYLHVGTPPGSTHPDDLSKESQTVFLRVSEKTTKNSEWLSRSGIEPGTSRVTAFRTKLLGHWWGLPVLRVQLLGYWWSFYRCIFINIYIRIQTNMSMNLSNFHCLELIFKNICFIFWYLSFLSFILFIYILVTLFKLLSN